MSHSPPFCHSLICHSDADFPSEDEDPFADIIDPEDCTKFFPLSSIVSWGPYVGGFTEYRNGVTSLVIERDTSMLKVENHDYCYSCNVRAVSPAWSVRSGGSGDASGEVEDLAAAMDGLNTEDDVWAKMTAGAEFNFKFDPKKAEQEMNP